MSHPDHFELLALPPRFALDEAALDRAYQDVQSKVHPDRFASGSAVERRVAMQWAARTNEAYSTLKSPAARARYLCERSGVPIDDTSNTAMRAEFLTQQLEWHEALVEAKSNRDFAALQSVEGELSRQRDHLLAEIGESIDAAADFERAARLVRKLMFLDRFASEASDVREALDIERALS